MSTTSPPVLSPGGTTGFNRQTWMDTIEEPTFQQTEFLNTIRVYPGKIFTQATVRKGARALGTTLGQSATGDTLTSTDITGTAITITPVGRYVMVEYSANEKAQIDVDLGNFSAALIERGLAETLDQAGLALVSTLTQNLSQAGIDAAMWRQGVGRLINNSNGEYGPGQAVPLRAIFSPTQYPNVMAIDEFTHADIRGDGENPQVKGIFTKGGGVNVRFSTVVAQDANGWHNPLYVEDAFIVGWNQRIQALEEVTELKYRVTCFANMGVSVLHDLRAIDLRSTASAL